MCFELHIVAPIRICFLPLGKNCLMICTLVFKKANTYFHFTMLAKGRKIILDYLDCVIIVFLIVNYQIPPDNFDVVHS